jgi:serine/threonine-protein kinase
MAAVRAGDIIAGKFQIERVLGEGGMGYVVAARHIQLGQTVALKFMREDVVTSECKSRFLREARNTVRLKSKHVSRVLDVGSLDSGSPYMVMEYLEGTDLSDLLHERGRFPVVEACDYIIQACEAISEAHCYGIIHRDLKPANLFLTRGSGGEPIVKVLDFGVSKVLELGMDEDTRPGGRRGHHDSVVTNATDLLGSPSYMAPEQVVSARNADARSDVWSLGVILFRLVSGKLPFTGTALGDLIQNVIHGPIPNLRQLRPDIPEGLEHVVLRCLDRDRDRRPDAIELARLLAPYAGPNAAPSLERIAILGPALVQAVPSHQPSGPSFGSQRNWSSPPNASTRGENPKKEMSTPSLLFWAGLVAVVVGSMAIVGAKVFATRMPTSSRPQPPTAATPAPVPGPMSADPVALAEPSTTSSMPASPSAKPAAQSSSRPRATTNAHTKPRSPSTSSVKSGPAPAQNSDIPSSRE